MTAPSLTKRFDELKSELDRLLATAHPAESLGTTRTFVDHQLFQKWCTKVKALLRQLAERGAQQYGESFDSAWNTKFVGTTNHSLLQNLSAVFLAAKEDCDAGWLTPLHALVRAEVFDDELDQAKELNTHGYAAPAAVIGRVVLETGLKNLCARIGLPPGKLAKMNDDLKKANAYDSVVHKRVTTLAAIGNAAAHALPEFRAQDVEGMLEDVRRFLEEYKP